MKKYKKKLKKNIKAWKKNKNLFILGEKISRMRFFKVKKKNINLQWNKKFSLELSNKMFELFYKIFFALFDHQISENLKF